MPHESDAPAVSITHITTDENGRTVTRQLPISDFTSQRTIETSPLMWATPPIPDPISRSVWVMPIGWEGGWHTNPQKQLVIPLSGRWWVQTQDGARTTLGPGEISLGDDLDAVPDEAGRIGHGSGNAGDEPVVLLMIKISDEGPSLD